MQALLASLVISMGVKDAAFQSGMRTARAEVKRTEQDFDKSGKGMVAAIDRAAHQVNAAAVRIVDGVASIGREVKSAGLLLTAGLTVPSAAMGAASKNAASDFESAMKKVRAAMINADPAEIERLRDAALEMGPAMGRSAIEAAGAVESLAKNGMNAADILSGGLRSALTLATVGEAELGDAADLTTDIMAQFGKTSRELPRVVDNISGALDASKMSFDDFRLAAGQAGGVTGALGYTFEDFNTGLAATAPLFDSGAQAGTSFRAFLISLAGKSDDARKVMKQLGIELYNADGSARSLAQIADELQRKMGALSDRSKNVALDKMFGTDGGQTAVKLIQLGAKGIEDARKQVEAVTADQKIKVLLEGEAAATERLAASWEKLKIAVGAAGLLQVFTWVNDSVAAVIETVASAPPAFFYLVTAAGLAAATLGPLVLIATKLLPVLALLVLRGTALSGALGIVATGFGALLNPAAFLVRMLGQMMLAAGVGSVIGRLGAAMLGFAGPIGLAATALSFLLPLLLAKTKASASAEAAVEAATSADAEATEQNLRLATATGKARAEIVAKAKVDRIAAIEATKKARADVEAARAALLRAREDARSARNVGSGVGDLDGSRRVRFGATAAQQEKAVVDLDAQVKALDKRASALDTLGRTIAAGSAPADPKLDIDFNARDPKSPGGRSTADVARDAARSEAQYLDEIGRARVAQLQAQADLTGGIEARYRADIAALDEDRAATIRQTALDEGLTAAQRARLLAARDAEQADRRAIVERERSNTLAQQAYDLDAAVMERAQERQRAEIDVADSIAARRAGELRLLDLQRAQEEAELDLILATKSTASAEWDNARKRRDMLDQVYAERRTRVGRQNEGAGDAYLRQLGRSSAAIREDVEAMRVDALKGLNSDLTDAVLGTQKLGDAFVNMGKRMMATLIDIVIQQRLIRPLANMLLGGDAALGGSIVSQANGALSGAMSSFGGFRKNGGPISPNEWFVVGEDGPEVFAPGTSGSIIPNGGLRGGQSSIVRLVVGEGQMFEPRVTAISGNVSVQTVRESNRAGALSQRQRLA